MFHHIDKNYNILENECDLIEIEEDYRSQKVKESLNFLNKLRTDKGNVLKLNSFD